ncbi:MAG TPA: DUF393 domain-containing protein [Candidatus Hydrogenedentes bacterium]|nr:DUF393 domain-containing protein [Candidatus Hydrogenedentota bacterium]
MFLPHPETIEAALPIVIIYDGNCPVCTRAASWFLKRIPETVLEAIPCQSESRTQRFPQISEHACLESIHVVALKSGVENLYTGPRALAELLKVTPHYRLLGKCLSISLVSRLLTFPYFWFARRRYIISAFMGITCKPAAGESDKNCVHKL